MAKASRQGLHFPKDRLKYTLLEARAFVRVLSVAELFIRRVSSPL